MDEEMIMVFVPEPIIVLNLVLCVVILLLGYLVYRKRDIISALFIGIAFGIFGLSHLNTLFVPPLFPEVTFALLRICGYLIVSCCIVPPADGITGLTLLKKQDYTGEKVTIIFPVQSTIFLSPCI